MSWVGRRAQPARRRGVIGRGHGRASRGLTSAPGLRARRRVLAAAGGAVLHGGAVRPVHPRSFPSRVAGAVIRRGGGTMAEPRRSRYANPRWIPRFQAYYAGVPESESLASVAWCDLSRTIDGTHRESRPPRRSRRRLATPTHAAS